MATHSYTVKPGDNLWNIAREHLGHGNQWRRIWRYNNRADVVRITGRGIPNPNLIYPGQVLLLPIHPAGSHSHGGGANHAQPIVPPPVSAVSTGSSAQPLRAPPPSTERSMTDELNRIESPISIKYRLDDLRFPPIIQPGMIVQIRMTGDIILMTSKTYPALYVTQRREIELQVTNQANAALGSLTNDTRLIYSATDNTLTYRSMLVTASTTPNAPSSAVGFQFDSSSPMPGLRFEFRYPKLQGSLPLFNYSAVDVKIVIEVTPRPDDGPSAQPLRSPVPVRVAVATPAPNWNRIFGVGLLVAAGAIVVGTLVEDFFTAGGGIIDDPASFAAAGAAVTRGLQLVRGAAAVLPAAAAPAMLMLRLSVQTSGAPSGQVQPR